MTASEIEVLHKAIRDSRDDIKKHFDSVIANLTSSLNDARNKITLLEQENLNLKRAVKFFEKKDRKNNLIISGLQLSDEVCRDHSQLSDAIVDFFKEYLDFVLDRHQINNIFCLGGTDREVIKLELNSFLTKAQILKRRANLKNTKIYFGTVLHLRSRGFIKFFCNISKQLVRKVIVLELGIIL